MQLWTCASAVAQQNVLQRALILYVCIHTQCAWTGNRLQGQPGQADSFNSFAWIQRYELPTTDFPELLSMHWTELGTTRWGYILSRHLTGIPTLQQARRNCFNQLHSTFISRSQPICFPLYRSRLCHACT